MELIIFGINLLDPINATICIVLTTIIINADNWKSWKKTLSHAGKTMSVALRSYIMRFSDKMSNTVRPQDQIQIAIDKVTTTIKTLEGKFKHISTTKRKLQEKLQTETNNLQEINDKITKAVKENNEARGIILLRQKKTAARIIETYTKSIDTLNSQKLEYTTLISIMQEKLVDLSIQLDTVNMQISMGDLTNKDVLTDKGEFITSLEETIAEVTNSVNEVAIQQEVNEEFSKTFGKDDDDNGTEELLNEWEALQQQASA